LVILFGADSVTITVTGPTPLPGSSTKVTYVITICSSQDVNAQTAANLFMTNLANGDDGGAGINSAQYGTLASTTSADTGISPHAGAGVLVASFGLIALAALFL